MRRRCRDRNGGQLRRIRLAFHCSGRVSQRWCPAGSAAYFQFLRMAEARDCRARLSARIASAICRNVPVSIQSVASAAKSGEVHRIAGAQGRREFQYIQRRRAEHIGDPESRSRTFGQGGDVPGDGRRQGRNGWQRLVKQFRIGIVLDDCYLIRRAISAIACRRSSGMVAVVGLSMDGMT